MAANPLIGRSAAAMHKQQGVTLVELMIVVVIVGILAAIAYPNYRAQVLRSHRSDAKVSLERAAQELERCYTNSQPKSYAGCPLVAAGARASDAGHYSVVAQGTATTFLVTATAVGGQLGDDDCRTLTLDNTNLRSAQSAASTDTSAVCWRR
jgi:type IV pilus assembly protein PilE